MQTSLETKNKLHEHDMKIERLDYKIDNFIGKLTHSVEHLDKSVVSLSDTVGSVRDTIFGGGGNSPLFPRVAVLEAQMLSQNDSIKTLLEQQNKINEQQVKINESDKSFKLKLMGLCGISALGIVGLLICYLTDSNFLGWAIKMFK